MPIYEHACDECKYEWEDLFSSYKEPVPEACPNCKTEGKVRRLLSLCAGKVELTGKEAAMKAYSDGKKLAQQAKSNENILANVVGEEKYHKQKLAEDKA